MTSDSQKSDITRKLLQQLKQEFLADLPERLSRMEYLLFNLKQSNNPIENFQELYRRVHSLKGSAGTHDVHIISRISHLLEDHLLTAENDLKHIDESFIDDSLRYLDLMDQTRHLVLEGYDDLSRIELILEHFHDGNSSHQLTGLLSTGSSLMTMICRDALEDLPVRLHYAENGLDALARLIHEKYDFLILSKQMALLNGTAVTYAMRSSGSINQYIKIIMITTDGDYHCYAPLGPDYIIKKDMAMPRKIIGAVTKILQCKANTKASEMPK